jgi:hypothetical protein
MIKALIKFIQWSLIASFGLALIGIIVALIIKIPLLEGAYIAVLIGAVVPMLGAVMTFAAPSVRKKYLSGEEDEATKGSESLPFAIAGLLMMSIAFFIEAMMH